MIVIQCLQSVNIFGQIVLSVSLGWVRVLVQVHFSPMGGGGGAGHLIVLNRFFLLPGVVPRFFFFGAHRCEISSVHCKLFPIMSWF